MVAAASRQDAMVAAASRQGTPGTAPPGYQSVKDELYAVRMAAASRQDAMVAAASRQGTPAGTPGYPMNDDLYQSIRMSAASRMGIPTSATGTPTISYHQAMPSSSSTSSQENNLSRLAPSVYSHPNVQDPILKAPNKGPNMYSHETNVLGPKKGFNVTSSGAHFDQSAISGGGQKKSDLQTQNDIIAQLTKEMKLNGQLSGQLSGGSDVESSGSTTTLNNPAATADQIAALAIKANLNLSSTSAAGSIPSVALQSKIPTKMKATSNVEALHQHIQSQATKQLPPQVSTPQPPTYESSVRVLNNQPGEKLYSNIGESRKMSAPLTLPNGKPDNLPLLSRSQPDLSELSPTQNTSLNQSKTNSGGLGSPDGPQYTQEMFDIITNENRELKGELERNRRKIAKLDNLEKEMLKIHEAYTGLREHSEKRELLEKSARAKLQTEILNHQEINKEIRERHDAVMAQIMSGDAGNIPGLDSILRGEIMRKDSLISQLANQNKELMAAKERQDVESAAQRETLQEQRTHIDVLDSALSTAQSNVLKLEEEVRQKEVYVERVKQMTKSLEQLQAASEKREAMEKKLRAKLEEELKELRENTQVGGGRRGSKSEDSDRDELLQKISEAEEKIIRLESERTQWEQRYLEESAMRQIAIDAASIPKDAKIAVLEQNGAESEKMIAEARSDKLKQTAEIQHTVRKCAEMELKMKALESSLAERNAMVKVLQKRAFEKNNEADNVHSIQISEHLPSPAMPIHSSSHIFHSKQLSTSHLGSPSHGHQSHHGLPVSISHTPQLSTPSLSMLSMPPNSPSRLHTGDRQVASDFFDGISSSMSSTVRGPLAKFTASGRVSRSGSPGHLSAQRSATPSDMRILDHLAATQRAATPNDFLRAATPTSEMALGARGPRRDSAPGDVFLNYAENPSGKTLINTSDLYTSTNSVATGGTLPKMSFVPMREEASRTMPTHAYNAALVERERLLEVSNVSNAILKFNVGGETSGRRPGESMDPSMNIGRRPGESMDANINMGRRPGESMDASMNNSRRPGESNESSMNIGRRPVESIESMGRRQGESMDNSINMQRRQGESIETNMNMGRRPGDSMDSSINIGRRPGEHMESSMNMGRRSGESMDKSINIGRRQGDSTDSGISSGRRQGESMDGGISSGRRQGEFLEDGISSGRRPGESTDSGVSSGASRRESGNGGNHTRSESPIFI